MSSLRVDNIKSRTGFAVSFPDNGVIVSGVVTASSFSGPISGIASSASKLENTRTFEITGDIVAAPQNFNGTQNVSLASSIQPNTVGLGTHTYGDYVKNIIGTPNQIDVSVTSGEGVSPQISLPSDLTISNNLTVSNDLQVNNNLNVNGNITVGGTTAYLIVDNFLIKDRDIVTGFTTNLSGNDVSNDITANTGGISVASTEGSPLVNLNIVGIETLPPTYKKLMWFKEGSFAGLNTDAWMFNYGVGIGSTQIPSGVRLAVGGVQIGELDISRVKDINASGIVTANSFRPSSGYIQAADGTNSFYIYSGTGNVAFQGTIGVNQINNASGYKVIGFAGTDITFENNAYISGVTTSSNGFVGNLTGTATTATNVIGGIGSLSSLTVYGISTLDDIQSSGIITATEFSTGSGSIGITTNVISGPSVMFIDPAPVGNNSGILRIKGDLYVDGTQTIINSTQLLVKNLKIGVGVTTSDEVALNGAGIGIGSTSIEKTLTWEYISSSFKSSENLNLASGKTYKINGTEVLSSNTLGPNVVNSSLTSVGTLNSLNVSGVTTSSGGFVGNLTGTATTATNLSDAANITTGTINSSRLSGTYNIDITGSSSYATTSGIATYAVNSGIATYAIVAGVSTYSNTSGIATYSNSSGISSYSSVSGIATYSNTSGIATNVIGGIGSITQLSVSGISTFSTGPVLIGSGTSTGTSSQSLQVTGGSYISGNLGIGSTNPQYKLDIFGGDLNLPEGNNIRFGGNSRIQVLTGGVQNLSIFSILPHPTIQPTITELSAGGSGNTLRIAAGVNVRGGIIEIVGGNSTDNPAGSLIFRSGSVFSQGLSPERMRIFNTGEVGIGTTVLSGTSSQPLQVMGGSYISGNLGIGSTNPTSKLTVVGNGLFTGIVTASGGFNLGISSGGTTITSGPIRTLNFIGAGNTFNVNGTTVDISIQGGGGGGESYWAKSTLGIHTLSNVGIGTTNPTSALSVSGDGIFTGVVTASSFSGNASSATYATSSGVSTSVIGGIASLTSLNVSGVATITNNLVVNGNTLYVDAANNRVGIGTTNPTQPLQVGTGSSVIVIDNQGELGIRTTNPIHPLHINSRADLVTVGVVTNVTVGVTTTIISGISTSGLRTGFEILSVANIIATGTTVTGIGSTSINLGTATLNGTQQTGVTLTFASRNDGNLVVVTGIGSVGIGTTNPTTKLHVVGDINLDDGSTTFATTLQTITPTANRVVSVPDATGTLALVAGSSGQVIYNNAGANAGANGFTYNSAPQTLTVSAASTTTSSPILNLSQTWNAGAVAFTGVQLNITDTASDATSLLQDWQVGGASRFQFVKSGLSYYYNTSTSVSNYERAKFGWESNILRVGTEKLGTGVARGLELQTDGTTRVALGATTGSVTIPSAGVAGTSALLVSGTWTTGAGTTNTKPQVLIEPVGTISTTWSNNGTGLGINAASGFTGNLLDLQVNGTSRLFVNSSGVLTGSGGNSILGLDNNIGAWLRYATFHQLSVDLSGIGFKAGNGAPNVYLAPDANNILSQRFGTAAQTFRVYNTYTSGTNNEFGKLEWSSNVFRIGTEKGSGGGIARALELQTDGITRVAISTTGNVGINTTVPTQPLQVNSGSSVVTIDSMGELGIGTASPRVALDVIGNANISGVTTVGLAATSSPSTNSTMSFELTNNTTLTVRVRGSDGVIRTGTITLS